MLRILQYAGALTGALAAECYSASQKTKKFEHNNWKDVNVLLGMGHDLYKCANQFTQSPPSLKQAFCTGDFGHPAILMWQQNATVDLKMMER
jgi:hypothetical protein